MKKEQNLAGRISSQVFRAAAFFAVAGCLAVTARAGEERITDDTNELFKNVQVFADAISIISTDYVKRVDVRDIIHGAVKGMMATLDGYSHFLDQESFQEMKEETKGEFGGIGIEIGIRQGVLTVITPMDGTPAHEAGMAPGDKIVRIDGEVTRNMTLSNAVRKLRGVPGTRVAVTVIREDTGEMIDLDMKRAVIEMKSIKESRMISENIAYIRLLDFQERTGRDLAKSLAALADEGAESLILDLRNNPGGLLDAAVEVADRFLDPGALVVYTEGRDPDERMDFFSGKEPDYEHMDVVVLVNGGSASAAEILAGALQDNRRALLVGSATFGKGSVQTVIPLKDNSALRLTTAAYYTPSGRNLMDRGIEPDIHVERRDPPAVKSANGDDDAEEETKTRLFEKLEEEQGPEEDEPALEKALEPYDNQLQAAVNIIKGSRVLDISRKRQR